MGPNPITEALLGWYQAHARALPWRALPGAPAPDPYRVWLSEVMLQQTTVAAVVPYFNTFTRRWPDVAALAAADEGEVMAAWAGLGYYARARNLIAKLPEGERERVRRAYWKALDEAKDLGGQAKDKAFILANDGKSLVTAAFARANRFDWPIWLTAKRRLGIISTGKAYLDLRQALDALGIDEARAAELGVALYKVGLTWPLETSGAVAFARDFDEIVVIEEKRGVIEEEKNAFKLPPGFEQIERRAYDDTELTFLRLQSLPSS